MSNKTSVSTELSRDLTMFQLTMMGMGMMIGAGVCRASGGIRSWIRRWV